MYYVILFLVRLTRLLSLSLSNSQRVRRISQRQRATCWVTLGRKRGVHTKFARDETEISSVSTGTLPKVDWFSRLSEHISVFRNQTEWFFSDANVAMFVALGACAFKKNTKVAFESRSCEHIDIYYVSDSIKIV